VFFFVICALPCVVFKHQAACLVVAFIVLVRIIPLPCCFSFNTESLNGMRSAVTEFTVNVTDAAILNLLVVLSAVQILQQMPLNLTMVSPAHSASWDLVADTVNAISRIHRSPKLCKLRYENVIIRQEKGKIVYVIPRQPDQKAKVSTRKM